MDSKIRGLQGCDRVPLPGGVDLLHLQGPALEQRETLFPGLAASKPGRSLAGTQAEEDTPKNVCLHDRAAVWRDQVMSLVAVRYNPAGVSRGDSLCPYCME